MRTVLLIATMFAGSGALAWEWTKLPSLPDTEGFAGPFAGVSNGALLVGGGANFPEKKPWDRGKKVWYDTVFVLEKPDGKWKVAGRLPRPVGYGVSVTHRSGVVCVGGGDADRHYADAFRLEWKGDKLITTNLPPLPKPVAYACGALINDDILFVAGGQEQPDSTNTLRTAYRIHLGAPEPKWEKIEDWPGGGRMLAIAAGMDGAFYLVGGVELVAGKSDTVERKYLKDGYRYDLGQGWTRLRELSRPVAAAPSPAPADAAGFSILGGDDGSQVGVAPQKHRGFARNAIRFDLKTGKWLEAGDIPSSTVTVPCVLWNKSWVVPGGEVRPGVRSPEVWTFTPGRND
jgi:N-acetylneuraminate epimerase